MNSTRPSVTEATTTRAAGKRLVKLHLSTEAGAMLDALCVRTGEAPAEIVSRLIRQDTRPSAPDTRRKVAVTMSREATAMLDNLVAATGRTHSEVVSALVRKLRTAAGRRQAILAAIYANLAA